MPASLPDDPTIDELLKLAGVSTADPASRDWIGTALAATQAIAKYVPPPSPAKHNAPLDAIEGAVDRLIATLDELRRHPVAHAALWRFARLGPVRAGEFERPGVTSTLSAIREAARRAALAKLVDHEIRASSRSWTLRSILRKVFTQKTERRRQKFFSTLCRIVFQTFDRIVCRKKG